MKTEESREHVILRASLLPRFHKAEWSGTVDECKQWRFDVNHEINNIDTILQAHLTETLTIARYVLQGNQHVRVTPQSGCVANRPENWCHHTNTFDSYTSCRLHDRSNRLR